MRSQLQYGIIPMYARNGTSNGASVFINTIRHHQMFGSRYFTTGPEQEKLRQGFNVTGDGTAGFIVSLPGQYVVVKLTNDTPADVAAMLHENCKALSAHLGRMGLHVGEAYFVDDMEAAMLEAGQSAWVLPTIFTGTMEEAMGSDPEAVALHQFVADVYDKVRFTQILARYGVPHLNVWDLATTDIETVIAAARNGRWPAMPFKATISVSGFGGQFISTASAARKAAAEMVTNWGAAHVQEYLSAQSDSAVYWVIGANGTQFVRRVLMRIADGKTYAGGEIVSDTYDTAMSASIAWAMQQEMHNRGIPHQLHFGFDLRDTPNPADYRATEGQARICGTSGLTFAAKRLLEEHGLNVQNGKSITVPRLPSIQATENRLHEFGLLFNGTSGVIITAFDDLMNKPTMKVFILGDVDGSIEHNLRWAF